MGLIILGEILVVKLSKFVFIFGCVGMDFGEVQRLNCLIFKEIFVEGSETKEFSLEFGFKLIL
jgi:hypothetical protein